MEVIYIPLCLYLYLELPCKLRPKQDLHSTMFIFICEYGEGLERKAVLFTFHYVYIYIRP